MPLLNFDATKVDPSLPFEAIPSGRYLVEITKSEQKPTKAGDGSYLSLEYTVLEGEYHGRKLWDRLCLNHPTAKTVEIARANLSAICHAIGVIQPHDSIEMHHIPFIVTVKTRKDETKDEIYNEVKGYAKYESAIPETSPQHDASQWQADTPVDNSMAPWNRVTP